MDFVEQSTVELIKHNASDEDVARAAWVSNYGEDAREKETGRIEGLINYLYKNKHMSPFEHGSFTFFVDNTIFVAREFMRHRTASYNETSGRYKELEPRFYIPSSVRPVIQQGKVGNYTFVQGDEEMYEMLVSELSEAYEEDWARYQRLLEAGFAKEVARISLPVGIFTQFYVTMNPRNLMQFLTLRNDDPALYEIREVAVAMEKIFAESMPLTYKAYATQRERERTPAYAVGGLVSPDKKTSGTVTTSPSPYVVNVNTGEWTAREIGEKIAARLREIDNKRRGLR